MTKASARRGAITPWAAKPASTWKCMRPAILPGSVRRPGWRTSSVPRKCSAPGYCAAPCCLAVANAVWRPSRPAWNGWVCRAGCWADTCASRSAPCGPGCGATGPSCSCGSGNAPGCAVSFMKPGADVENACRASSSAVIRASWAAWSCAWRKRRRCWARAAMTACWRCGAFPVLLPGRKTCAQGRCKCACMSRPCFSNTGPGAAGIGCAPGSRAPGGCGGCGPTWSMWRFAGRHMALPSCGWRGNAACRP